MIAASRVNGWSGSEPTSSTENVRCFEPLSFFRLTGSISAPADVRAHRRHARLEPARHAGV